MSVSVTLKLATSIDGRIALADGTSQWITSSLARAKVHEMRATHDAVMVGIGTVLADDPMLTARTVPLPARQPLRIVVDSQARTPVTSRLANSTATGRVVIATTGRSGDDLIARGVEMWACGHDQRGGVDLDGVLRRCAVEGVRRVFLEGGGRLAAAFIRAGLVEEIAWFRAPILIGGDGQAAIGALQLPDMSSAPHFQLAATARIGNDVLETYKRADV